MHVSDFAYGWQKAFVWVFGVNARFHRMAVHRQFCLLLRQRLARSHAQLPFHQVLSCNHLGHRVFHLQACVHFHEVEFAALLGNEFHRARAHITDGTRCIDGGFAHLGEVVFRHVRRWRFFQHFLVAALYRAIAFKQMHVIAVGVAKYLYFHVAWAHDVFFYQHVVVAKAGFGFAFTGRQ